MGGAVASSAGTGQVSLVTVGGTWVAGDLFNLSLTEHSTSRTVSLGSNWLTAQSPTYVMTYHNKANLLCGSTWGFSELGLPTSFNNPDGTGNGYVYLSDAYSESDSAQALLPYQGRLAVLGKNNIQIWQTDADPINYQLVQVLENVGTLAKNTAIAFGELDIFFLHQTGIRSLRVRDASNNAYLSDTGSPVDFLVQASLSSATDTQIAASCGVMEPSRSQYWCYLYDTIYVLSYHPQAKVTAWSTFKPTYQANDYSNITNLFPDTSLYFKISMVNDVTKAHYTSALVPNSGSVTHTTFGMYVFAVTTGGTTLTSSAITGGLGFRGNITLDIGGEWVFTPNQTAFTPEKFVVYNGQVIARAADGFYVYGGADKATYDNSICTWKTSWLDAESPSNYKQVKGMDVAQTGTWNYYGSIDYLGGILEQVLDAQATPSFMGGRVTMTMQGTHMQMLGHTAGVVGRAVISNLLLHYKGTGSK